MEQYIPKSALVAEIENLLKPVKQRLERDKNNPWDSDIAVYKFGKQLMKNIDTLEVKEVELMIYTIIAECCDWLAAYTELSHEEIEGCRNLMLTVKDEQLKAQKGEKI